MLHDCGLPGPGLPSWLQTSSVATLVTLWHHPHLLRVLMIVIIDDPTSPPHNMSASMWTGLKEALHCMQGLSMIVSFSWNTQVHLGLRQWFSIILWSTDPVFHHCLIQNLGVIIVTRGNIFRRSWLRSSVVSRISFHLSSLICICSWPSLGRFTDLLFGRFAGLLTMAFSFYDGGGIVHHAQRRRQGCRMPPASPGSAGWPPGIPSQSPNRPRHLDMMLPAKSCPRITFPPNCSPLASPLHSSPSVRWQYPHLPPPSMRLNFPTRTQPGFMPLPMWIQEKPEVWKESQQIFNLLTLKSWNRCCTLFLSWVVQPHCLVIFYLNPILT